MFIFSPSLKVKIGLELCYTNRTMRITTSSAQETIACGKKIAARLRGGDIVCLYGELGAGKTTFVKGVAEGLGVKENIASPTFTLMNVYNIKKQKNSPLPAPPARLDEVSRSGKRSLVHIDTYRLKNEQELAEIGALDYIGQPDTIAIVEWPEKIAGLLKNKKVINIFLDHRGETARSIFITK